MAYSSQFCFLFFVFFEETLQLSTNTRCKADFAFEYLTALALELSLTGCQKVYTKFNYKYTRVCTKLITETIRFDKSVSQDILFSVVVPGDHLV